MPSRQFDHPLIEEVHRLGMPDHDNIVINHSAALAIWGIPLGREPSDIDFATSLENIEYLREKLGWQVTQHVAGYQGEAAFTGVFARDAHRRFDAHQFDFSRERYAQTGQGKIELVEQKTHSVRDETTGIYVATPEFVLMTKRETGRKKDELDVIAIETYLKR